MPKKTSQESTKKVATVEEGVVYVSAAGTYYEKPRIDADKIKDSIGNNYLKEPIDRLQHQIFGDDLDIEVIDKNGDSDDEIAARLWQMCEQNDVNLWSATRVGWKDTVHWGPALFNPVWTKVDPVTLQPVPEGSAGGEYWLQKLRRLPPETFRQAPSKVQYTYSEILPGIVLNDAKQVEFWQMQDPLSLEPKQVKDVVMIKDPSSTELAGTSAILSLVPLVTMLNFSWQAQMQKVNRVGAPVMFIKINNPVVNKAQKRDDIAYANEILKNWGKGSAYQLRDNMEIVMLDFKDSEVSLNTIEVLRNRIRDYFSPNQPLQKEGNVIGGNAAAEKQLYDSYIKAQRFWIEDQFERLLQVYLDANGYEGYTVRIHIGSTNLGVGDLEVKQAQVGWQTRVLTVNEVRAKLGELALTDEEIAAMIEEWTKVSPAPQPTTPFGFQGMTSCGFKEHAPTEEERQLEENLHAIYEKGAKKVIAALRSEGTGSS
jgi:hypothetical protein